MDSIALGLNSDIANRPSSFMRGGGDFAQSINYRNDSVADEEDIAKDQKPMMVLEENFNAGARESLLK